MRFVYLYQITIKTLGSLYHSELFLINVVLYINTVKEGANILIGVGILLLFFGSFKYKKCTSLQIPESCVNVRQSIGSSHIVLVPNSQYTLYHIAYAKNMLNALKPWEVPLGVFNRNNNYKKILTTHHLLILLQTFGN